MKKRKEPTKDEAHKVFAEALAAYLKANGWTVLVVGNVRIEQRPNDLSTNYECVVRFIGGSKHVGIIR